MIPHHRQAVEMADLALEKASSEAVVALAKGIKAAQDPEIEKMQGWLSEWGRSEGGSSDGMGGMDHGSDTTAGKGAGRTGMLSDQDMADLQAATGAAFDEQFLELMIEHHEGAIEMAEVERSKGKDPEAVALAGAIVTAQEGEIAKMRSLLDGGS